ncbi:HisA/HisF-related TIM barrel protein [Turicibacter sanguinis]|uniref:oxidoreductase n=1 Tax=Turicibacter sanguinis TaxID=154288 RepID=UPI0018ABBEA9|nr:NADH:flavin oxidoreductase [Turicibacter sanguinis]MCU7195592.1 NADH:flavin oxidoreductase [Turicibacter sanguinis]MDB8566371.1 NADH:flavin oxidoreductase [Turicibacter sanguinis]MDB8569122.1 NADH:flavin oxidoreductase [Turicibacter sanguinis]MDB8571872.1 NADH:flavin oxidoreductase [Turicibacter sanguinis]MDB8581386.1 NADH:flavin oxidoreductase [Turicibacter sanguinis]
MSPFKSLELKNLSLSNRFVRSATHDYAQECNGLMSDKQLEIYEELARNQVGLIMTGHLYVSKEGRASEDQNAIDCDAVIPRLKEVVDAVHQYDSKFIAQLAHAGAKARVAQPVGPSELWLRGDTPSLALTHEGLKSIRHAFIDAAKRAKEAGFDGVQVHMAHGYLLSEFITPQHNLRQDEYGGSVENRFRFPREIILGIKQACGENYPIFIKINSNVELNDEAYESDLLYMLNELEALGVEAVELSGCDLGKKKYTDHNYYLERASRLAELTTVPLILVGGIRTLSDIEHVLQNGIAMVSFSRPFICEPNLVRQLKAGHQSKCVSCNCCYGLYYREGRRCIRMK